MDPGIVLALFDEQLRKHPLAEPGERIEAGERVTRRIAAADGWTGVIWSDLDEASAGPVIDAQIRRFAALGQPWEWKYYSYDQPADLPERLRAARHHRSISLSRDRKLSGRPRWSGSSAGAGRSRGSRSSQQRQRGADRGADAVAGRSGGQALGGHLAVGGRALAHRAAGRRAHLPELGDRPE